MQVINPRMDIISRERKEKSLLLRFVKSGDILLFDPNNEKKGRGYYLDPTKADLKSIKKIEGRLKASFDPEELKEYLPNAG